ncbi:hypothetical protein SY2F82_13520 [Streptomyces sp. Y2F8-2]|nr:hypothetical protein SY2F82_13520 [Streptomyces sp. Y2F8-2]
MPPANGVLRGDAEGYVGVLLLVRGVPSVRRRWCWAALCGAEVACDAGVRARSPKGLRGQPAYERSLHAGRPDTITVWHPVSPRKALGARKSTQMKSLRNK